MRTDAALLAQYSDQCTDLVRGPVALLGDCLQLAHIVGTLSAPPRGPAGTMRGPWSAQISRSAHGCAQYAVGPSGRCRARAARLGWKDAKGDLHTKGLTAMRHFVKPFRRPSWRVFAGLGAVLSALALSPLAASAHFAGGNWTFSGAPVLPLTYRNEAGAYPAYSLAIDTGAANWTSTPSPSDLISTPFFPNIVANTTIDVVGTEWGVTHLYTCTRVCVTDLIEVPFGGFWDPTPMPYDYTAATITLNRATLEFESDFIKVKVATHELGHAQGLDHAITYVMPGVSISCTAVMQQGRLTFNTPTAHDIWDMNRLYPSPTWPLNPAC